MPLVSGDDPPPFWARRTSETLYLYIAHPKARELRHSIRSGQSLCRERVVRSIAADFAETSHPLDLEFEPFELLPVCVSPAEGVRFVEIAYRPPEPACNP